MKLTKAETEQALQMIWSWSENFTSTIKCYSSIVREFLQAEQQIEQQAEEEVS